MIGFREFINETSHITIDIDAKDGFVAQIEKANEDLEAVTAKPFINSSIFINSVRGTLERYGIILPAHANLQQLASDGEYVYSLGETGQFVYIVFNPSPEGHIEGYAQIVSQEDLDDLLSIQGNEMDPEPESVPQGPSEWAKYPKARRDDDSGNDNEYA